MYVFYFLRCLLALVCSGCEAYFYKVGQVLLFELARSQFFTPVLKSKLFKLSRLIL